MDAEADDEGPLVRSLRTRPGRVVFTEDGNTDAWIAADCAVELER